MLSHTWSGSSYCISSVQNFLANSTFFAAERERQVTNVLSNKTWILPLTCHVHQTFHQRLPGFDEGLPVRSGDSHRPSRHYNFLGSLADLVRHMAQEQAVQDEWPEHPLFEHVPCSSHIFSLFLCKFWQLQTRQCAADCSAFSLSVLCIRIDICCVDASSFAAQAHDSRTHHHHHHYYLLHICYLGAAASSTGERLSEPITRQFYSISTVCAVYVHST